MTQTSAVDFSHYLPPGVYTNPMPGPQLAVNSSLPTAVALFGTTIGFRTYTESVLIEQDDNDGTVAVVSRPLAKKGIVTDTSTATPATNPVPFQVKNTNTGSDYVKGVDYTIETLSGQTGTSTATYGIKRIIATTHIAQQETVQVVYRYTDDEYFNPYVFYDYDDVRAAYGDPFNAGKYSVNGVGNGGILSELTLAAKFAFMNGAYQVVCVAVKPTDPAVLAVGDYEAALKKLQDQARVAIVVPCNGKLYTGLYPKVADHVENQSANRFERRAIVGVDGTTNEVGVDARITLAGTLGTRRVALVSPDAFDYYSPELNQSIRLGGQFMAASLAGMAVKMSYAQPLTHKVVTGWSDVPRLVEEGKKNEESKNGVLVIEKTRRQKIWVRHGVTTDNTDLLTREWNIVGQEDAMVYRLRDYLESANLIGQPIYDYTLVNVKSSAEAALQSLLRDGLMVNYTGLKARQLLTNPDVIEISYSWLPAMPLNYIVVTFAISLTTGSVNSQGTTANSSNYSSSSQVGSITTPSSGAANDFGGSSNTLQTTL